MSKSNGFLPLRRGLWEHIRDGRMSVTEALAFIYICSEADTRAGIWKGCAKSLSGELGIADRTAREVLERLECSGYIRRFAVPGRHVCYPILIHKYLMTNGEHNGKQLNAIDSKSPTDLAYFSREQSAEQDGAQSVEQSVKRNASQKRSKTREPRNEKRDSELRTCELHHDGQPSKQTSGSRGIERGSNGKHANTRPLAENLSDYIDRNNFITVAEFFTYEEQRDRYRWGSREEWQAYTEECAQKWGKACKFLHYKPDSSDPCLTFEFLDIVSEEVEKRREYETTPARICMKILDRCQRETPMVPFPPSFLAHKTKLYEAES